MRPRPRQEELDVFESPEKRENRRPRRNSESSIIDRSEEERRRRERRRLRAEREAKEGKDGKDSKDGKPREGSSRPRRQRGLDIIDKLDVTGIYGAGLFHHDGPFDACNPHRNRKKDTRAPMQAFPVGSKNNALGGSGPLNKNIDIQQFNGTGAEGFTDFNTGARDEFGRKRPSLEARAMSFNPTERVEPVHGEETVGLGTSTFLEGAPASRVAIQRRESQTNTEMAAGAAGLQRKKSLAQRIRGRGMSGSRPSRELRYGNAEASSPESPQPRPVMAQSAGGPAKMNESNPFFNQYGNENNSKANGASIKIAETDLETKPGRARAPSSPMRGLERRRTADSPGEREREAEPKSSGGFLSRVKSLKGGKRPRPERPLGV
ncbi:Pal1-domain-containing protein [Aulographum hederae CBS 113979]|uniref:Pal1-domain-containing protein n=1 Tax=Aulographum hederae CBS 113979 TaxID=1176131 RepID=A0A6G1GWX5_9PEZI|nr:Pal1-domain-containing protein [Aulographum hederae CBS 113979]